MNLLSFDGAPLLYGKAAMSAATRARILLVDDEPNILTTLAVILSQEGYTVSTASTVAEALRIIGAKPFDALIADLNIGEPGDGFTVVSGMRRTHPHCVNFILTGYPAFETALQAIRNQVDDYLVKPANVHELVRSLETKLNNPQRGNGMQALPLSAFLRENTDEIINRVLAVMKSDSELAAIPLTDQQRIDHIPGLLGSLVRQLESNSPERPSRELLQGGARHGATRRRQRYSHEMLVDDRRAVDVSIYDSVQDGLLRLQLSRLIPDLRNLNHSLSMHLQESLKAFDKKAA